MHEHQRLPMEVKSVDEIGSFIGVLATYGGRPDLQGDVIEKGAFSKTLKERGSRIPLFLDHNHGFDVQVGLLALEDTPTQLLAHGKFNLDLPKAREAYSNLKFNKTHGIPSAMSIGFRTIRDHVKDGIRFLSELALAEGSLCLFPANKNALVGAVKSQQESKTAALLAELRTTFREGTRVFGQGRR